MNRGFSLQSSKYSKLTEDKQHTAVLSSLVGKVISEQRLLCLISKPKSFCSLGNASLHVSILTMYGSPVSALALMICHHKSLAFITLTASLLFGSTNLQSASSSTAFKNSLVMLIPL